MKKYDIRIFHKQKDLDELFDDIYNFCKMAVIETQHQQEERNIDLSQTISNMAYKDWETNNECLLYKLYITKRFGKGNGLFSLIYSKDNKIVATGGSELLNNDVGGMAKRIYVLRAHRKQNFVAVYFLPSHIKWFNKRFKDIKIFYTSFNEYNKAVFLQVVRLIKKPEYGKWNIWTDWKVYPTTLKVYNVQQHILYHTKDDNLTLTEIKRKIENDI